jgi:protein-disulfide isomerase
VGRNRRRGNRRASGGTPAAAAVPARRSGWRGTIESFGGLTVVGSIVVAVVVVGALIYLNRPGASVNSAAYTPRQRDDVDGTAWGKANAPVKMIEFADFQCPFCDQWWKNTEPQLSDEFIKTGQVQLIFHDYAFLGNESVAAAEAAACAADQGHFWDYHDLLYLRQGSENSGTFSGAHLKGFAQELHQQFPDFDAGTFSTCLDSGRKKAVIDQETAQAKSAGVQSTPTFLVNGQTITGAQDISVFRQAITQAMTQGGATPK